MSLGDALDRLRRPFEGPNTIGNSRPFWIGFVVVLVGLFGYPIGFGSYAASSAALYLLYAILALSLTVIWGYTGILSFGQVAFFGIAGYSFALISMNLESTLTTMLALPIAVGIATLAALVLGYFMFYGEVRDVYVTILTLVVALVLNTFMAQTAGSKWTVGSVALGGFNGIPAIPSLTFGVGEAAVTLDGAMFYWFTLVALLVIYLALRALVNGRFGYAMVATREDEDRTEMLGYDVRRIKLLVFALGGALAGLSGVLYASWGNYISPSVFGITFASIPVVWVAVGGRRSLLGAVVATVVIEWFRQQLSATGSQYAMIVVGVILLLAIVFVPEGVIPRLDAAMASARDRFGTNSDTVEGTPE